MSERDDPRAEDVKNGAEDPAAEDPAAEDPAAPPGAPGPQGGGARVDDEGLPLDRPATLDDVRGTGESGRGLAIGCTAIVAVAVLLFWLLRGGVFG